ncbi:MAG: L,D-transpeptidase [Gammaproteobacteria bacterium]|nr:L,D-transpeptidase [Gammaproteobacteria bacterium]
MVTWQQLHDLIEDAQLALTPAAEGPLIHVDSQQQLLTLVYQEQGASLQYPVSTSRHGIGQREGSLQTPAGIHRIAAKIGAGEPLGRVFQGRQPQEQICLPQDYDGETDWITTRILWLDGLQPGLNRDGEVDTKRRYIYIHGTADEAHIGQPASIGCVRMNNQDVIELFERVAVDDLVIIQ